MRLNLRNCSIFDCHLYLFLSQVRIQHFFIHDISNFFYALLLQAPTFFEVILEYFIWVTCNRYFSSNLYRISFSNMFRSSLLETIVVFKTSIKVGNKFIQILKLIWAMINTIMEIVKCFSPMQKF